MQKRIEKVGMVLRKDTSSIHIKTVHIIYFLLSEGKKVIMDELSFREIQSQLLQDTVHEQVQAVPMEILGGYCDVVLVIGGDGTLLAAARSIVNYQVPIVGINRGRLGFLTQVPWDDLSIKVIQDILSGDCLKETRIMVEGKVIRAGKVIHQSLAMNEVTISRGGQGSLIEFEVFINQQFVYTQHSDGLIIATPTGSTAYSLAAGGPILYATLPALNLVPICSQSMTNRPIVIDSASDIEVLIVGGVDSRIYFDGQSPFELQNMDNVQVKTYERSITLLQPSYYRYFDTLRQKLRWGEQLI